MQNKRSILRGSPTRRARRLEIQKQNHQKNIVKRIQEYFPTIKVILVIIIAIAIMIFFQVKPWESYEQISERKKEVAFHLGLGQQLLDYGHYREALSEFEFCLQLDSNNHKALIDKSKTNLFLQLMKKDWKPNLAFIYINSLNIYNDYNISLLKGLIYLKIKDIDNGLKNINKARTEYKGLDSDYYEALYILSQYSYLNANFNKLKEFSYKMTQMAPFDYRGCLFLGLSQYLEACELARSHQKGSRKLLEKAQKCLLNAVEYTPSSVSNIMDRADFLRITDPDLAIKYREKALSYINDEEIYKLEGNNLPFSILLYKTKMCISLDKKEDKIAWIKYEIAIDYYVKWFLNNSKEFKNLQVSNLKEANKIQKTTVPFIIYKDQLEMIKILLTNP